MSAARLPAPQVPEWLQRQLPFTRYQLRIGRFAMHVMECGEGLPVLMLHGNPTWGFLWRKVASELRGEPLRLIMPDLLGLGLSEHPVDTSLHTLEFHARVVGELIDALALERFVFVAQDWGGAIGGLACAARASRVAGLVLMNTVMGPPKPDFTPNVFHAFAQLPVISELVFRVANFPARGMEFSQGDRSSLAGDVGRAYRWVLRNRLTNGAPLAMARMVPDSMGHPSIPALQRCEAWVGQFSGPAALVWGERDPILGRVKNRLHRLLPHAQVTTTQAGHFLQEEVPREIAEAIRSVTREVLSFRAQTKS